jgi:tetratricopeptide (TPR) repeat protein
VWENEAVHDTVRLDALSTVIKKGLLPNQPDSALILAKIQLDYAEKTKSYERFVDAINTHGIVFFFKGDYEKAEFYYSKCMQEAKRYQVDNHIAKSYNNLGMIYVRQGMNQKGLDYYKKSLSIKMKISESSRDVLSTLNNIGLVYSSMGDYTTALQYFAKCLKLSEKSNEYGSWSSSLNNIGGIYKTQRDYDKALVYYEKSLKLKKQIDDRRGMAKCYNNIGIIYRYKKEYEVAIDYLNKSMQLRDEVGDFYGKSKTLNNLSNIYTEQGEYAKALECDKKSLAIQRTTNGGRGLAITLNNLARTYIFLEDYKRAINHAKQAFEYAEMMDGVEQKASSSNTLYDAYVGAGNYKEALKYYRIYVKSEKEIRNDVNQKALISQEYKYEYEKQKALDDSEHEKQLALEQEAKEKQQIITYATGVGLGLVAIFLVFVFNRLKVTRKQKGIIEMAHLQLEEKNSEILDSINYAKRIQGAILPSNKIVKEYLTESFVLYKPKDIVAGDFYWMEHRDDKVMFAAADCTGHGVPGAMVSVVCNNGLNRSVREFGLTEPGKILDKTRELVIQEFEKSEEEVQDGMDIALCTLDGMDLQYAGAHNPLWIIRNEELIEYKGNKQPIGKFDNPIPFRTHDVELQKGDTIYIFSDGFSDQFGGEKGKKMKSSNFKKLLLSIQEESMDRQKQLMDEAFEKWRGDLEQLDDVCVIGVRI